MSLLPPTGPFAVGSATHRLPDPDRPVHLLSPKQGRKLFLKLWYPAEPATGVAPEVLWTQLRDPGRTPRMARGMLRLIQRTTASYPGIPLAPAPTLSPVVYNHGLVSFASENTSLAQDLASHGRIVIAVEHEDQLPELKTLNRQQPLPEKALARDLTARMRRADAAERAHLAGQLYAAAVNTKRIVLERARDTLFVLDNLASVLGAIPGRRDHATESSCVHLVGYSLGGAVATHLAGRDSRAASVVNIDGGMYGSPDSGALSVPYLMMYSARNEAINDELLPMHATRLTAPNTSHLNFHDVAGLVPPLRWIRIVGPTDPTAVLRWRNRTIAAFLNDTTERRSIRPGT